MYEAHRGIPGRPANLDVRVADHDRQATADLLKAALDEGRLPLLEYDHRLGLAYAAVTYRDLSNLLADLPTPVPPAPKPPEKTSPVAMAGLGLAIVLVFTFWVPFLGIAIDAAAIILGVVALIETRRKQRPGTGLAVAALLIGLAGAVPSVLITDFVVNEIDSGFSAIGHLIDTLTNQVGGLF
jgi:Domain of unknown function (DUF1707)